MPDAVAEATELHVRYQDAEALVNVSFRAEAGDYVGIVGPNGSGKTTLIKTLLGLLPVEKGEARLFGESARGFRNCGRVGYLPQKGLFLDPRFPATAVEIVALGLLGPKKFPRVFTAKDHQSVAEVMDLLDVWTLRDRPIGRLSGGQQQRVLLARALVSQPQLLILDEPTVALDPQTRDTFYSVLTRMNKERGVTVLLVSHDISSVGEYASKLLYLDREVIFYGRMDEFCRSPLMTQYFGHDTQHLICHRH